MEIGQRHAARRQRDADRRYQRGGDERQKRQHKYQQQRAPARDFDAAPPATQRPFRRGSRPGRHADIAPARQPAVEREAGQREQGEQQRERGDLREHARAEARQPLVDQRDQYGEAGRDAEESRYAKVADIADEREHSACGNGGNHQRQHDRANDAPWLGACRLRGLDQVARQRAQTRTHGQKDDRRLLEAQQQDDALRTVERMRRPRRWRETQRSEQSAVRSEQIDPRQRRDLWRDHQRQHEAENQRLLAAQIGKCDEQRECAAERHREDDATQRHGQRVAGSAPDRRVLENAGEQCGVELAAGRQRLLGETADRHDSQ